MERAMARNAVFERRIGDILWYWVMRVRHLLVPATTYRLACQGISGA
jgi:hypothetical protein